MKHTPTSADHLATLLELSKNIASTLELEPLLELILEQLKALVDYSGSAIYTLEHSATLQLLIYRGPIPQEQQRQSWSLSEDQPNAAVIETRSPVIIPDILANTPDAQVFREAAGELSGYMRSWMAIPMIVRDRVIGMISFDHQERNAYTSDDANLVLAFASQVGVAIENARLYQAEQSRRHEAEQRREIAEGLRDILAALNSTRSLEEILDLIVTQASRLLNADAVALLLLEGKEGPLKVQTAAGMPVEHFPSLTVQLHDDIVGRAVLDCKPVVIPNMREVLSSIGGWDTKQRTLYEYLTEHYNSVLAVPLIIKDEAYGCFTLYYLKPQELTAEEIGLASAFSDQAALAIENAKLRAQAEQTAAVAERSRLARELHDAVTQTLFSASLIAEIMPRLWKENPAEGERRMDDLRRLTRGALAEMRSLLLELRPAGLAETPLGDLLRHLVEAVTGRSRLSISLNAEEQRLLPPDAQIALYRIAQEALNNVIKHAKAATVQVVLYYAPKQVEMIIRDDGRGFDINHIPPGHLGVNIMRERADAINAVIDIESQPDHGTQIRVIWPEPS